MKPPTIAVVHFAWCQKVDESGATAALDRLGEFVTQWDPDAVATEGLFARCQSPSERLFVLGWMLGQSDTSGAWRPRDRVVDPDGGVRTIEPQPLLQTQHGPRHPDFAIWHQPHPGGPASVVYVEIDGHEFHQATRWQVARDRQRERAIAEGGDVVIRFTGGEVHRDPRACADEAVRIARALAKRRAA